jgi:CheY-like chemotaxis protein
MSMHILLIDDEDEIRELLKDQLSEEDCTTSEAPNGAEGLKLLCSGESFDLIFLDVMMPEKNGIETLKEIRQLKGPAGHLPVIMLTGYADKKLVSKCMEYGINDYLVKPWNLDQLVGRVLDAKTLGIKIEDIRDMLQTAHIDDETVLGQQGLLKFSYDEYNAFPKTFKNQSLVLLVKKPSKAVDLASLTDEQIVQSLLIFHKKENRWVYCWPTLADFKPIQIAKPKKRDFLGEILDDE